MVPSSNKTQVWYVPADIWTAVLPVPKLTGVEEGEFSWDELINDIVKLEITPSSPATVPINEALNLIAVLLAWTLPLDPVFMAVTVAVTVVATDSLPLTVILTDSPSVKSSMSFVKNTNVSLSASDVAPLPWALYVDELFKVVCCPSNTWTLPALTAVSYTHLTLPTKA